LDRIVLARRSGVRPSHQPSRSESYVIYKDSEALPQRGTTMKFVKSALLLGLASAAVWAQVNAGEQKPEASMPFNMTTVSTFELPWRLAFLPDGRMLITEKVGPLWLVTQQGDK